MAIILGRTAERAVRQLPSDRARPSDGSQAAIDDNWNRLSVELRLAKTVSML